MHILNKISLTVLFLFVLVFNAKQSHAQYSIIPKVRFNSTISVQQIEMTKLKGINGIDIGIELQGKGNIYFNPGIFYTEFSTNLIHTDITNTVELKIAKVHHRIIKLPLNLGMYLTDKNKNISLRFLLGFQPVIRIGRADLKSLNLEDSIIQKNFVVYGTFGIGIDFKKLVFDVGYEIDYFRLFFNSDKATNFFTVGLGYRI